MTTVFMCGLLAEEVRRRDGDLLLLRVHVRRQRARADAGQTRIGLWA